MPNVCVCVYVCMYELQLHVLDELFLMLHFILFLVLQIFVDLNCEGLTFSLISITQTRVHLHE